MTHAGTQEIFWIMPRRTTRITALFYFSFAAPATSQLVGAAYGLALAVLAILGLLVVIYAVLQPFVIGVLVVTATATGLLACAVFIRLWLGAVVALSRIEERTEEIAEQLAGIALNTTPVWAPERGAQVERHRGNVDEP